MEFHETAQLFPLMEGEEYRALVEDIRRNGLREPIWVYQGKIVDGRNRYRACRELGIQPRYREWDGKGSLVSFVVSMNLHRRHLSESQRAAIAVQMLPLLEAEAKERQREHGGTAPGRIRTVPEKFQEVLGGEAAEQAAKLFGTNARYVYDAKKLSQTAPDVLEEVRAGVVTLPEAKELVKLPQEARREAIQKVKAGEADKVRNAIRIVRNERLAEAEWPKGKYRVIYTDPPWKYGNTMPDYFREQADHYPLMTVDEICALPVRDLAEDDAVLFLWATSPILEDAFRVINAWGFKYKASFVWDKVKHNMGHYNSVRHEFLLIATRGSCQPDNPVLFDSVVSIERGEHSEKPEHFRKIIDTLYPHGRRIELFARKRVEGWDSYGNELS